MKKRQQIATFMRWVARVWGSLILAFLLFMVIAHLIGGEEGGEMMSGEDMMAFAFFPLGTMLGLALGIKWDGLGACIIFISQAALFIVRPDLMEASLITMAIGPGILYLISWTMTRKG